MCELKKIYDSERKSGKSPEDSSIPVLNVLTNGLWSIWDSEKVNQRIDEIIDRFEEKPEEF